MDAQFEPTQTRPPSRAILGGLSLLLVVAFAFQAANPLGAKAAHRASAETVFRMVVEASVRQEGRVVRRDQHRPGLAHAGAPAGHRRGVEGASCLPCADAGLVPPVRRNLVLWTSLPPPHAC